MIFFGGSVSLRDDSNNLGNSRSTPGNQKVLQKVKITEVNRLCGELMLYFCLLLCYNMCKKFRKHFTHKKCRKAGNHIA